MEQLGTFLMTQRVTPLVNRYVVTAPDGGDILAFGEQKRFTLKEELTFWTGEDRARRLGGFKALKALDFGTAYDVTGADGRPLGFFRKDAKASLLRSTWHLAPEGRPVAVGRERSVPVALARRAWQVVDTFLPVPVPPVPFVYHFDFFRDGEPVLSVERLWGLRDRYVVRVRDPELDPALALCVAAGLDALQAR